MSLIFKEENIDTALMYVKKAEVIAKKANYLQGVIDALNYKSTILINNKPIDGLSTSLEAIGIYATNKQSINVNSYLYSLVNVMYIYKYYKINNLVDKYRNSIDSVIEYNNLIIDDLYIISVLIESNEKYRINKKSYSLIEKSLNNFYKNKIFDQYSVLLVLYAQFLIDDNKYNKALEAISKVEKTLPQFLVNQDTYIWYLNVYAKAYLINKNYKLAEYYYLKALLHDKKEHYPKWKAINERDLAILYKEVNSYQKAIEYANKYLQTSITNSFPNDILLAYELLGDLNARTKNYKKAYEYLNLHSILSDSIILKEQNVISNNAVLQYELSQQEGLNSNLKELYNKTESDLKDKKILQIVLIVISMLVFISSIFTIYLFIQNRINLSILKDQSKEIIDKNDKLEAKNTQLEVLNNEKNTIIGIVSHDLRAPIGRIEALLNMLKTSTKLNAQEQNLVEIAFKEAIDCKKLIHKILDSETKNNSETPSNNLVPLNGLLVKITNLYSLQASQKNIEIIKYLPTEEIEIISNQDSIVRILENLISNAIKFSPPGKKIYVNLTKSAKLVSISIRDEGPGLSQNDQKNMFKKYHRLSAQPTAGETSTGLGLYIVKTLANEVNASIIVESKLGLGATFTVNFPI
ncbi:MAG: tetratricopeptide repeat-containing sensor histidine kinase [Bacteroidota bacterium]|nr:tetratricopeptide repeat-containing sensor histidine kinase [Bacteroidota bacterium]